MRGSHERKLFLRIETSAALSILASGIDPGSRRPRIAPKIRSSPGLVPQKLNCRILHRSRDSLQLLKASSKKLRFALEILLIIMAAISQQRPCLHIINGFFFELYLKSYKILIMYDYRLNDDPISVLEPP